MPAIPACIAKSTVPHPEVSFERLVEGLSAFRREYHGQLWVEVMLVRGLNDMEEALREIAATFQAIHPDQVHINLPTRPPNEPWVQPSDEDSILRAQTILGDIARVVHPAEDLLDLSGFDSIINVIVAIITRHPMREDELMTALERWTPGQVRELLTTLINSGQAQVVERYGTRFWSASGARYPKENI